MRYSASHRWPCDLQKQERQQHRKGEMVIDFKYEVMDLARRILSREEFRHYNEYSNRILDRLSVSIPELRNRVEAIYQELEERQELSSEYRRRSLRVIWPIAISLGALAVACAFTSFLLVTRGDESSSLFITDNQSLLSTLSATLATIGVLIATVLMISDRARRVRHTANVDGATRTYQRQLDTVVNEELARAINDELGPEGFVAFPTIAPRLVEIDTSNIVPSETVSQVKDFIMSHESSAIGLAGMRGSGKSTVMRALAAEADLASCVAIIPSPVKYDPAEFSRRLLTELAAIIGGASIDSEATRLANRVNSTRVAASVGLAAIGIFLLSASLLEFEPTTIRLSIYVLIGVCLLIVGGLGIVYSVLTRVLTIQNARIPSEVRRARNLMRMLRWEIEQSASTKNTLKLKALVEMVDEDTIKLKSKSMSHVDFIVELRGLLGLFAENRPDAKLVVCIDELDKLGRVEDLIAIINELKDLFHIRGVHFVVAVSTEALASFEKRGLPSRDAFDSSFDTIIRSRWLDANESLDVISSRSAGFAPLVGLFCYAWSGGLARDLLRAARKCVESQRADTKPLSLRDLVERLVLDDLSAAVEAFYGNRGLSGEDAEVAWRVLKELEVSADRPHAIVHSRKAVESLIFMSDELEALRCKVILGLRLIELAESVSRVANYWDTDSVAMRALEKTLTYIATAVGGIAAPSQRRMELMQRAISGFGASPLVHGGELDEVREARDVAADENMEVLGDRLE